MKVLYFLTHVTNSGGMEHIVIDKINYLANHGYYVSLAYLEHMMMIRFSYRRKG